MAALAARCGRAIRFSGVGGPQMSKQGLTSLFPYTELSVMGLVEVLPSAPRILQRMRQVAAAIERDQPDALITIDAPGFCVGVVKRLRNHAIPRIHYVAPTVWAWRAGRVHKFRRHFDHLLALLPFEPPYFKRAGLPCTFVGHPVVETRAASTAGADFRRRHDIAPDVHVLCLLPGSRRGEVTRLLAPFGTAAGIVAKRHPDMAVVVPTVNQVESIVGPAVSGWPLKSIVITEAEDRHAAMASADFALAASGTVALELAVNNVPAVIGYKVAPLTAWMLRRIVRVRYANIVNILADREVVPEHLQGDCQPDMLARSLLSILDDRDRRESILAAQAAAIKQLSVSGSPSSQAASTILSVVSDWSVDARPTP